MIINGVAIDDTFAEAFGMRATRILITALDLKWAYHAARAATGFATSVIGCGCEAGIEYELSADESPDGRPGVTVLLFAVSRKELAKQVERRVGQCVLTAPTSAVFSGIEGEPINLGKNLRFFGDGYQNSKVIGGRRYWRIPVMDGEFLCEETTGMVRAVGGGNVLVLARGTAEALAACEAAIAAMSKVRGAIMPFPGGVVRSGSKVGSKYKALTASTNDAYCPTLRGAVKSELSPDVGAVLEIVIDGLTESDVRNAMRAGIAAACEVGSAGGVLRISAGNYGGKLGQFHFRLHEIVK
ncbi:MAG TPA: formylmethanofuran--tetrahydromethanopterin N-formyltransferase [Burkholderiales bacterium]|jgi:formylmethanofuran--tetrahydromethanopterin N-formyltransferase|nr:formylmethanofuran--tetrahydromethanopterin N-formyltransferase [Burkholderiales bacterium]